MKDIQIAASLLSADFGRLAEELKALELAGAEIIHLDVMDGHYVPNLSFGFPVIKRVRELTDLPLDVHLMVTNPAMCIEPLSEIGVQWISFHQECDYHAHRLVNFIRNKGIKAGLALNPAVPVHSLVAILAELDFVLLMSVNPGFSGQSFISSILKKCKVLKSHIENAKLDTLIEIDGGVNNENSAALIEAGADILVSASYIFSSADYGAAIRNLRSEGKK
ncbi:MAG: ribulose-phosphate 3-epimerase [Candidatus Cloacimonadaceae bacterium]|nr:ribulose-phosphate 3-epimerase [Candidatus Cloacimonadaceae bacterium]MDP3115452.1 ribulose-phosphate 3-epimerase [Candidatus Cloacimonadaceae bacterium]